MMAARYFPCRAIVLGVCFMFLNSGISMSEPDNNMSMVLRDAAKVETISADIALKVAELVFRRNYGDSVTEHQLPLSLADKGDRWEIEGSRIVASSRDLDDPIGGKLHIVIMKADCRIVELTKILVSHR